MNEVFLKPELEFVKKGVAHIQGHMLGLWDAQRN